MLGFARMKLVKKTVCAVGLAVALGSFESMAQSETPPDEAVSATQRALDELSDAYAKLAGLLGQGSDQAVDRVQSDIENLGDWDYKIVELPDAAPEALEAELNELGDQRWEVYWVESTRNGTRFYLKRPSISYLSRVPLSTLMRMLSGAGQ